MAFFTSLVAALAVLILTQESVYSVDIFVVGWLGQFMIIYFISQNIPEDELDPEEYKQIIVYPWRVIYSLKNNIVYILIVIDGRRDLQDILYKKLMK